MSDYDTDLPAAYPDARRRAEAELLGLPEARLWTVNQVLDHGFWPAGDASV